MELEKRGICTRPANERSPNLNLNQQLHSPWSAPPSLMSESDILSYSMLQPSGDRPGVSSMMPTTLFEICQHRPALPNFEAEEDFDSAHYSLPTDTNAASASARNKSSASTSAPAAAPCHSGSSSSRATARAQRIGSKTKLPGHLISAASAHASASSAVNAGGLSFRPGHSPGTGTTWMPIQQPPLHHPGAVAPEQRAGRTLQGVSNRRSIPFSDGETTPQRSQPSAQLTSAGSKSGVGGSGGGHVKRATHKMKQQWNRFKQHLGGRSRASGSALSIGGETINTARAVESDASSRSPRSDQQSSDEEFEILG